MSGEVPSERKRCRRSPGWKNREGIALYVRMKHAQQEASCFVTSQQPKGGFSYSMRYIIYALIECNGIPQNKHNQGECYFRFSIGRQCRSSLSTCMLQCHIMPKQQAIASTADAGGRHEAPSDANQLVARWCAAPHAANQHLLREILMIYKNIHC